MSLKIFTAVLAAVFVLAGAKAAPVTPSEPSERQTWQTENGLPQNTVHALLQSKDGYIWVGTEGGIARFDGIGFQVYSTETFPQMQSNDVRALAESEPGVIWAATAGGVVEIRGRELRSFGTESGLPSANILAINCTGEGELIASTPQGVAKWRAGRFVLSTSRASAPLKPPVLNFLAPTDPLRRAGVLCALRDHEGNNWVGTELEGLTVIRQSKFSVYTSRQGLSGDAIRCVFETRDGSLWIGTANDGLTRLKGGKFTHWGVKEGLASDVIISLGENSEGALLIGTPDGLNVWKEGRVSLLTSADGLPDDLIRSIAHDRDKVYVGTRRGVSAMIPGHLRTYTESDGLGSNTVGAMLPGEGGELWIATLRGLSRLDNGNIRNFTKADGLTSEIITALYRDADQNLWVGTQGGSLVTYSRGNFHRVGETTGLPKVIYGIAEDQNGSLWLSSTAGLCRVERRALLQGRGEAVFYGTNDGLLVNEASGGGHPTIWKSNDSTLWFATPRGLATMTPSQAKLNRVPPPVNIQSISVDDRITSPKELAAVQSGHTRYAFDYVGLSFVAPQKVRYKYKLEGFDRIWIDAGSRRTAYYTNLSSGTYRFHVIARNNDGYWSTQEATASLTVEPHLYQRWWFVLSCSLALSCLVYGGYRWRVRQVAARYDVVLAERSRIAREIHDTLAQGFVGLAVQLEVLSRLLTNPTEAVSQQLKEARALVHDSLAEARRSIWELRSQSSITDDLATRLGRLTRPKADDSSPRVTLAVQGTFRPLPQKLEDELFRIAEEAVRNALNHASPKEIRIALSFDRRIVKLAVDDDGQGFDMTGKPGPDEGHFGLEGMRERATQIGATFRVRSAPGEGSSIAVEAPIK